MEPRSPLHDQTEASLEENLTEEQLLDYLEETIPLSLDSLSKKRKIEEEVEIEQGHWWASDEKLFFIPQSTLVNSIVMLQAAKSTILKNQR